MFMIVLMLKSSVLRISKNGYPIMNFDMNKIIKQECRFQPATIFLANNNKLLLAVIYLLLLNCTGIWELVLAVLTRQNCIIFMQILELDPFCMSQLLCCRFIMILKSKIAQPIVNFSLQKQEVPKPVVDILINHFHQQAY